MKITIEGASEEFTEQVLAFAAQQGANLTVSTVESGWTVARAERYLHSLTAGARTFARIVIDGEGRAEADTLRRAVGKLNGPTVSLSRTLTRGAHMGWWPEDTPAPIEKIEGPDHPSWQKAEAYVMTSDNVEIFRKALTHLTYDQAAARAAGLYPGGEDKTSMPFSPDEVSQKAYSDFKLVDLDGGSLPADGDQDEVEQP
jgi:hypothetical protein